MRTPAWTRPEERGKPQVRWESPPPPGFHVHLSLPRPNPAALIGSSAPASPPGPLEVQEKQALQRCPGARQASSQLPGRRPHSPCPQLRGGGEALPRAQGRERRRRRLRQRSQRGQRAAREPAAAGRRAEPRAQPRAEPPAQAGRGAARRGRPRAPSGSLGAHMLRGRQPCDARELRSPAGPGRRLGGCGPARATRTRCQAPGASGGPARCGQGPSRRGPS